MKKEFGFSLIELLVVIAIVGILAVIVIGVINPIEQINRARDTAVLNTMSEVDQACDRRIVFVQAAIFTEDIFATLINQDPAQELLEQLQTLGELRKGFSQVNEDRLSEIYFSSDPWLTQRALCFRPRSRAFLDNPQTQYDQQGYYADCDEVDCYYCLISRIFTDQETPQPTMPVLPGESTPTPTEIPIGGCDDFDPEYPNYPWTCNYSNKWQQYSCTNYCVADEGCDDYCPEGQRHLVKNYSGQGDNFVPCFMKRAETQEHYCVDDPYARCDIKDYSSYPTDFDWGCTNPRRPTNWKED